MTAARASWRWNSLQVLAALLAGLCPCTMWAQIRFRALKAEEIESRLKNFSTDDNEREVALKNLFSKSGCAPENLTEQVFKTKYPPNVICVLPGKTDKIIVVGAHTDHISAGDGVVDNWSGAALLPSLLYSISDEARQHTFVFIGFTQEEKEMLGSEFYVSKLSKEERAKIVAMVNMDTLGLGPTEVWSSHADKELLDALATIADLTRLPISTMNVDGVGSTDSESFAKYKIPRITLHSVTQATWSVLHSKKDKLDAIHMDDYYKSYRLIAAYLAYLDTRWKEPEPAAAPAKSAN